MTDVEAQATIAALREEIRALKELAERRRQLLHEFHERMKELEAHNPKPRREP